MAAEIFSCPAKLRFKYGNDKCVVGSAQLEDLKKTDCSLIIDCAIKGKRVETRVDALLRSDPRRKGKQSLYVPVRFTPMEKITRTEKLLLAFDAVTMSESLCQTL